MIILDTNVISEALRPIPAVAVTLWLAAQPAIDLFTTAITEAEIMYGIAVLPTGRRRLNLERAVAAIFGEDFIDRILAFDSAAARAYGDIAARRRRAGRAIRDLDAQIAAIASSHGAIVATRNMRDFVDCGIDVVNPWQA